MTHRCDEWKDEQRGFLRPVGITHQPDGWWYIDIAASRPLDDRCPYCEVDLNSLLQDT